MKANVVISRRLGALTLASVLLTWAMASAAVADESLVEAQVDGDRDLEIGAIVGGNWNLLTTPSDPEGEFTLLWGSAFSGKGMQLGASVSLPLTDVEGFPVRMTADLMHGYHRGSGWAEHEEGGRIDVRLSTHVIRIPVLARLHTGGDSSGITVGAGVEPIFGLMSAAHIELTDVEGDVQPLETTPTAGMAGVLAVGFDYRADGWTVPFDLRVVWNPFVKSSSEERFKDFESPSEPGDYRVAFDWQVMLTAGMRWDL